MDGNSPAMLAKLSLTRWVTDPRWQGPLTAVDALVAQAGLLVKPERCLVKGFCRVPGYDHESWNFMAAARPSIRVGPAAPEWPSPSSCRARRNLASPGRGESLATEKGEFGVAAVRELWPNLGLADPSGPGRRPGAGGLVRVPTTSRWECGLASCEARANPPGFSLGG